LVVIRVSDIKGHKVAKLLESNGYKITDVMINHSN
jgi:hypothetical protein